MRYAMGMLRTDSGPARFLCMLLFAPLLWAWSGARMQALSMHPHRPGHGEQQQLLQVDDQIRVAILMADTGTLDKYIADDFLGISANGTLSDKQQYVRRIGKREHQFSRIDIMDRKVRMQSTSAVVVTTANITATFDAVPVSGVFRYTRVYNRDPDGVWKMRNFEATRVSGPGLDELHHGVPVSRSR